MIQNAVIGSGRLETLTASVDMGASTAAKERYRNNLLLMGAAGAALTFSLPPAIGSGDVYTFMVSVVNTSNYIIEVNTTDTVDTTGDTIDGQIITASTGDTPDLGQPWVTASTSDTITLNATTTGGVAIGDYVQLIDIAENQWAVIGHTTTSGVEATPFSAAVS